jgi:cytochrome b6
VARRSPSSSSDAEAPTRLRAAREWARDRFALDDLAHLAAKKQVPVHRYTIFYYFGGMALFLFMVQVATGILLILY